MVGKWDYWALPLVLIVVSCVLLLTGCGGKAKPDHAPKAAAKSVHGDSTLAVVRVPLDGRWLTCVRYSDANYGTTSSGLSCDWIAFEKR